MLQTRLPLDLNRSQRSKSRPEFLNGESGRSIPFSARRPHVMGSGSSSTRDANGGSTSMVPSQPGVRHGCPKMSPVRPVRHFGQCRSFIPSTHSSHIPRRNCTALPIVRRNRGIPQRHDHRHRPQIAIHVNDDTPQSAHGLVETACFRRQSFLRHQLVPLNAYRITRFFPMASSYRDNGTIWNLLIPSSPSSSASARDQSHWRVLPRPSPAGCPCS